MHTTSCRFVALLWQAHILRCTRNSYFEVLYTAESTYQRYTWCHTHREPLGDYFYEMIDLKSMISYKYDLKSMISFRRLHQVGRCGEIHTRQDCCYAALSILRIAHTAVLATALRTPFYIYLVGRRPHRHEPDCPTPRAELQQQRIVCTFTVLQQLRAGCTY